MRYITLKVIEEALEEKKKQVEAQIAEYKKANKEMGQAMYETPEYNALWDEKFKYENALNELMEAQLK